MRKHASMLNHHLVNYNKGLVAFTEDESRENLRKHGTHVGHYSDIDEKRTIAFF